MAVSITSIFRGTIPGDGTGDTAYDGAGIINTNFTNVKTAVDLTQDLSQYNILGRVTAATGDVEKLTAAQVRTLIDTAGAWNMGSNALTTTGLVTAGSLAVDNLSVDANTLSSTTGNINIVPVAGSAIVLDGTINVDAGVVTGATSITSTAFVGTLSTAAQPNITSVGTLTGFTSTGIDDNATSEQLQIGDTRIDCNQPIFIAEAAAAETNVAGYGQIAVLNTTPSGFIFLDDTGAQKLFLQDGYSEFSSNQNYPNLALQSWDNAGAGGGQEIHIMRSRGTKASPVNISAGDSMGQIAWATRIGGTWSYYNSGINVTSTTATGNAEPTMQIYTGTDGEMKLFADGHLEVYGQGGDVSLGWSPIIDETILHVKNNGTYSKISTTVADGTSASTGYHMHDSSASGQYLGYLEAYASSHSSVPGNVVLGASYGYLIFSTDTTAKKFQFDGTGGSILYLSTGKTVGNLGTPTPAVGDIARVTDANAPSVGATVANGGSAAALVWYNGSNWTVIGV